MSNQSRFDLPMPLGNFGDSSLFNTPFKGVRSSDNNFEKTYMIMQESSADKLRMHLF
jgi:hypothetical protein